MSTDMIELARRAMTIAGVLRAQFEMTTRTQSKTGSITNHDQASSGVPVAPRLAPL